MKVRFWGVRGSLPTPLTGDEFRDRVARILVDAEGRRFADERAARSWLDGLPDLAGRTVGGNTACVEVRVGGRLLVFDMGSGFRFLGDNLTEGAFGRGQGTVHVFVSHTHWDHIMGWPFFRPAYVKGNRIVIYSPFDDMEARMRLQQTPTHFPVGLDDMAADIRFATVPTTPEGLDLGDGIRVRTRAQDHPGTSWAYRVEAGGRAFVYATDSEFRDIKARELPPGRNIYSGADLLVFDAQYTFAEALAKEDWGHCTAPIGIDLALREGARRLVLFHHDPSYSDARIERMLRDARAYLERVAPGTKTVEVDVAREGLEYDL